MMLPTIKVDVTRTVLLDVTAIADTLIATRMALPAGDGLAEFDDEDNWIRAIGEALRDHPYVLEMVASHYDLYPEEVHDLAAGRTRQLRTAVAAQVSVALSPNADPFAQPQFTHGGTTPRRNTGRYLT